jgi:enediyne biosynthesis protein E4
MKQKNNTKSQRVKGSKAKLYALFVPLFLCPFVFVSQASLDGRVVFTDVTKASGITFKHTYSPEKKYILETMSGGVALFDYDNDGWLDIYFVNAPTVAEPAGARSELWRNNGDGTFTDVTNQAGVADKEKLLGLGVAWCDFNEDGYIDLYVANDMGANYLYQNKGDGTFSEIGLTSGVALSEDGKAQASMGVAIGDYDHRGRWNIFVTNFSDEYNAFYRHEKGFTFTDVSYATQTARANWPYVGWGCGFFDFDNDGWLDLLVVNGHIYPQLATAKLKLAYAQRKLLYRNNRNGTFAEIGTEAGPAMSEPSVSRGAAFGDLDNDGDVDVVINNLDGAPTMLRNDGGKRNNLLALELIGGKNNRDAYGARVKVTAGDLVQVAERRSGGSYLSHNDTRLHFGLEQQATIDAVEVRWPNGVTQKFMKLPVNSFIRIKEGDPAFHLIPSRQTR